MLAIIYHRANLKVSHVLILSLTMAALKSLITNYKLCSLCAPHRDRRQQPLPLVGAW